MQPANTRVLLEEHAPSRGANLFRSIRRRSLSALLGAIALLSLHPVFAPAQGLGRQDLFNLDNLPSGDGATAEPDSQRARFIRLNAPMLTAAESPLHQPAPAGLNLDESRLQLNLFNGTTLTAAIEKTLYRNGTN